MTRLTTDPDDDCLGHGVDEKPVPQNSCYLVLSDEERKKGFVRPYRNSYIHVGIEGPKFPLRDLTPEEQEMFAEEGYVKFEVYPEGGTAIGHYWTQKDLDSVGKGCRETTVMGLELSETYARNPYFYGSTYCVGCQMHRPVGRYGEFIWVGTTDRVGT